MVLSHNCINMLLKVHARRYKILKIVISLMYLSLDKKRSTFYVIYFFIIFFYIQPFKSVHHENRFREVLNKDPVTKISSTEFAVFVPTKPKHSFRENFCP